MSKVISFIIPAYNSRDCLAKCLDSFLVNGKPLPETEVIVINDGSTDGTETVAGRYADRFPDVYRVVSKENGGHGSAINTGSRMAEGTYFKVIDADDWIVSENLPVFVENLRTCSADVVLTPFHQIDIRTGERSAWKMYCEGYGRIVTMEDVVKNWKEYDRCASFHGITYRTQFYNRNRHELPEKIFYEDQEYATIPGCLAGSICPLDIYLYQYSVGNSAQSVAAENRLARQSHERRVTADILRYAGEHRDLDTAAGQYLEKRAEAQIVSHYALLFLIEPDRRRGRETAERYHGMIRKMNPGLCRQTERKYRVFLLMNRLHIPYRLFRAMLHTRIYSIVRKSHRIEKETV